MAPPKFDDLGKQAKDLFNKGYNFGFLKIDSKTVTSDGIEFKTGASHNTSTSQLHGGLDLKYKFQEYGLTVTEKWDTNNTLGTELVLQDGLAKGLKLTFESSFVPTMGQRGGKIKTDYVQDKVYHDLCFEVGTKTLTSGMVVSRDNALLGVQIKGDAAMQKLQRHTLALGFKTNTHGFFGFVTDAKDFSGSVYHKVNPDLELAATVGWNQVDGATRFGLATQYQMDDYTQVRAKLSNQGQLGVGMTHVLKPGLKLVLSALVNMQNFNDGGHRVGLGLDYEP